MQGKQAKIVSPTQERAILGYLATTRYPARDRVMFLLSMKAGLRAKEMASLTWAMVTDAAGQESAKFRGDPLQQWTLRPTLCAWNNTKHTRTSISCASSCEASVRSSGVDS
jgi:integrase